MKTRMKLVFLNELGFFESLKKKKNTVNRKLKILKSKKSCKKGKTNPGKREK